MLVEINPHVIEAITESAQCVLTKVDQTIKQAEPKTSVHQLTTFLIHNEIQGMYWHFKLNANLTLYQASTHSDSHYLLYFVMSTLPNKTRVTGVYLASSRADLLIHCKKNADWVVVVLSVPSTLFLTIWDSVTVPDLSLSKQLFLSKNPLNLYEIMPLRIQKMLIQLVDLMEGSLQYDTQTEFLLKTYASFMVLHTLESLRHKVAYNSVEVTHCEGDIERIIKLERRLVDGTVLPPLEELAKEVGMSLTKFRELFKFIYNKPVYDYFLGVRMNRSKELLLQNYSVNQVSTMAGFSQPNNFSKYFKKHFGQSPSELKRELSGSK